MVSVSAGIIGGTVAIVLVLASAATVVIIVWLVLRHRMAVVSLQKGTRQAISDFVLKYPVL